MVRKKLETSMTGVYVIQNTKNGKRYVGGTSVSFSKRWLNHRFHLRRGSHTNKSLQEDWNLHGESSFTFRICEFTLPQHAHAVERTMIDYYKSEDPALGYNFCFQSEKSRSEVSERLKRYYSVNEHRIAKSDEMKKAYQKPERRSAISERQKERWDSLEAREQHSERMKKYLSGKTKEELRARTAKAIITKSLKRASKLLVVIQPEQCSCCSSTLTEGISDGH